MQKSPSIVVQPDEGNSFWSPKPANGYVEIKISPWNVADAQHTVFLDEIPPGCHINEHYHEQGTVEIFTVLSGKGEILLDGNVYPLAPETVIYVHNESLHCITNTSNVPLRFMVVISPCGLEERFKAMGYMRSVGDESPIPFVSQQPADSHGVKKKR